MSSAPDMDARPVRRDAGHVSLDRRKRNAADFRAYASHPDAETRERLIRAHLPLARAIARRFEGSGRVSRDDLQQVAALGLIKALDRFDPDNGAAFSTFAVPTIQGEIRRYFRDFTWTVRPPRALQELAIRTEREREQLTGALGRSPTLAELAGRIGCEIEELIDASEAALARGGESLDRPLTSDDDADTVGERHGTEDPGFAAAEAAATVEHLLGALPERDALVLHLRFREELTQAEIGRRIGCTQMHVSRILRAALARLADVAAGPVPPPPARQAELFLD